MVISRIPFERICILGKLQEAEVIFWDSSTKRQLKIQDIANMDVEEIRLLKTKLDKNLIGCDRRFTEQCVLLLKSFVDAVIELNPKDTCKEEE